ncbi:hypothetical protein L3X38_009049 [Prunus dulcis]|uniref:Uncharacterized protein n=1 Tax=Prunus dulcis TaxID=3755 RepID=A0AAD4ZXQ0_PRUDU|nr:hypothetical protein L3X38_009049 [Prunus dulcis]
MYRDRINGVSEPYRKVNILEKSTIRHMAYRIRIDAVSILTEKNQIAETGSSSRAIELVHIQEEIEEVFAVPKVKEKKKSRNALRKGSEGEEVRAMQVCLLLKGEF